MNPLNEKYIVGLTGGIGSGKTTVAKKFIIHGIDYIDADDVAREVVAIGTPCLDAIIARYSEDILLEDSQLNRRKLRHIIFNNPIEKKWLEELTHPVIHKSIICHLMQSASLYTLLVHPLLFETKKNELCDYTLAIKVSKEIQVERVCNRDNIEKEMANTIIQSQMSNEERCKFADMIIENNNSSTDLDDKITLLHTKLSALAHAKQH